MVCVPDGGCFLCDLPGKFREKRSTGERHPICVGDEAAIEVISPDLQTGIVREVLPRRNIVRRFHPKDPTVIQALAANIDQMAVMSCLKAPRLSLSFLDACLVAAELTHVPVLLLFNKQDLLSSVQKKKLERLSALYRGLGYSCFALSLQEEHSVPAAWYALLRNKSTLLLGNSGVGKSTLVNWIIPGAKQPTRNIVRVTEKGAHTTTHTEILSLPNQAGFLLDSPGIKEMKNVMEEYPDVYFPEIRRAAEGCFFSDCRHKEEPNCQVQEEAQNGQIAPHRYKHYLRVLHDYQLRGLSKG